LNSTNIHEFLSKKSFLIEFAAPWCHHCQSFETTYWEIADKLNASGLAVGYVDVSKDPAIAARFEIASIPALFLYRNRSLWRYSGPLMKDAVVGFATAGYLTAKALPIFNSPMGPLGIFKGMIMRIGVILMELLKQATILWGLPEWVGYLLVIGGFSFIILALTCVGVVISLSHHHKHD
jgi:thiol-disulfide isomerase/thioredoxin